jgi:RNA polymerase sigma-70 factor, ECF subfamily
MNDAVRPGALESPLVASDERDLVGVFLNRYRDSSIRIAMRILGDSDAAEDVAQDALIRAFKSWDRLASVDHQAAWVRRIVLRTAFNVLERNPKHSQLTEIAASTSGAEESMLVQAVLNSLPADQRALLGLALGEGLSYREISEALDIPMGTVASRINTAKASFRRAWEETR